MIWTAVGGRTSLVGPVLGAVAIGFLASGLRDTFPYWEVVVALVFVVVVLRWPDGMVGLFRSVARSPERSAAPEDRVRERPVSLPSPAGKPSPSLRFDEVGVTVGSVEILERLSFEIETRAIHCLIGPNGAGKTSAFNALTGMLPLSAGDIRLGRALPRGANGSTAPRRAGSDESPRSPPSFPG